MAFSGQYFHQIEERTTIRSFVIAHLVSCRDSVRSRDLDLTFWLKMELPVTFVTEILFTNFELFETSRFRDRWTDGEQCIILPSRVRAA